MVVGAGPGGLLAAGRAAECGAKVVVLERGPKVGRKLRICGKGRANITNIADLPEFIAAFGENGKFLYGPFSRFFRDDILGLLETLGVPCKAERGGRVFPCSDNAHDVADALERWAKDAGARFRFNARVKSLTHADGRVTGVILESNEEITGDAVIIATGGMTYPATGSTGDGYVMARQVGHSVVDPRPALTAMVTAETWPQSAAGVTLRNVRASLFLTVDGEKPRLIGREMGELLLAKFGVSGPIILRLSRPAAQHLGLGTLELLIDLKPALTDEQLELRFDRELVGEQHFRNYLPELLPKSLVKVFPEMCGIDPYKPLRQISRLERKEIIRALREMKLTITRMRPPEEAIVTSGGVELKEIDPRTMESKLVKGLYFAGEVADIDATTGGYNLQSAFTMGWIAGESAAYAE
ncbi:MAG: NAD(P)/FAD-dependent oxidoreductase [Armatimonadota bacterium]